MTEPRYSTHRRYKSEFPTPEEEQVFDACKAYTFNPEQTAVTDFTPTGTLYDAYVKFINCFDCAGTEALNRHQFGAALRRIFDLGDGRYSRRRVGGKLMVGFLFVKGPGSITVQKGPGNPALVKHAIAVCQMDRHWPADVPMWGRHGE